MEPLDPGYRVTVAGRSGYSLIFGPAGPCSRDLRPCSRAGNTPHLARDVHHRMGHTHDLGEKLRQVLLDVNKNLAIIDFEERFVATGSFLRGYVNKVSAPVDRREAPHRI